MANVALVRLKASGKFYEVGQEVPDKLEDLADLKEKGLVGTPNEAKQLLKAKEDADNKVAELEAKVAELQAEADALRNEATAAATPTEETPKAESIGK